MEKTVDLVGEWLKQTGKVMLSPHNICYVRKSRTGWKWNEISTQDLSMELSESVWKRQYYQAFQKWRAFLQQWTLNTSQTA